jgi:hypothetical protein
MTKKYLLPLFILINLNKNNFVECKMAKMVQNKLSIENIEM